jgi:hypothetical protein
MPRRKARSALENQESLTFSYYEQLGSILRDLAAIDKLIPREVSRYASASMERESDAIIQGRKHDLLSYIQTICRDHLYYAKRLMAEGEKTAPWKYSPTTKKAHGSVRPYFRKDQLGWKD